MRSKSTPPSLFVARDAAGHAAILTDAERHFSVEEGVTTATARARSRLDALENAPRTEYGIRNIRVNEEELNTGSPEDAMIDRIDREREQAAREESPASHTRPRHVS